MKRKDPEKRIQTLQSLTKENYELRQAVALFQAQAREAMLTGAEAQGKSLHILKILGGLILQAGGKAVVFHKTIVDLPQEINLAREEVEGGYSYRLISLDEVNAMVAKAQAERPTDGPDTEGDSSSDLATS